MDVLEIGEKMRVLLFLTFTLLATPAFGEKPHQLLPTDCSGAIGILLHQAGVTKEALFLSRAKNGRECLYKLRETQLSKAEESVQEQIFRGVKIDGTSLFKELGEKTVLAPIELWPPMIDRTVAAAPPQESLGALPDMNFHQYDVAQTQPGQNLPSVFEEGEGTILHCDGTAEFAVALAKKRLLGQVVVAINKGKLIDVFLLQRKGPRFQFQKLAKRLSIKAKIAAKEIGIEGAVELETISPLAKLTVLGPTIRIE